MRFGQKLQCYDHEPNIYPNFVIKPLLKSKRFSCHFLPPINFKNIKFIHTILNNLLKMDKRYEQPNIEDEGVE